MTSIVATLIADLKKEENQMCNAASHACAQFLYRKFPFLPNCYRGKYDESLNKVDFIVCCEASSVVVYGIFL